MTAEELKNLWLKYSIPIGGGTQTSWQAMADEIDKQNKNPQAQAELIQDVEGIKRWRFSGPDYMDEFLSDENEDLMIGINNHEIGTIVTIYEPEPPK